ncbi:MAG TPA: hypothetical protein VFB90_03840 [Dehalococcoidia bacterium]|nr:hypothetical protein [Dehalococcoidia bacterium]
MQEESPTAAADATPAGSPPAGQGRPAAAPVEGRLPGAAGGPLGGGPPPGAGPPPPAFRIGPWPVSHHIVRLPIVGGIVALVVWLVGLVGDNHDLIVDAWPEVLAITFGLLWLYVGYNDFATGLHRRLPMLIRGATANHPIPIVKKYLQMFVVPTAQVMALLIPGSMLLLGISFLTGILSVVAAACGIFLVLNMAAFLGFRRELDAFAVFIAADIAIILTNPGGIPHLIDLAN